MDMRIDPDEKSLYEIVPYPDMAFPFCVWPDVYNLFVDHTVNAHWHYDFEIGYVVAGFVDYYINNTCIRLQQGDCVFVNSNALHMSKQPDDCENAIMFTITFSTNLLTSDINSTIYSKYIQPIIYSQLEGFKIASDHSDGMELGTLLIELLKIYYPASLLTSKTISKTYKNYFQQLIDNHLESFKIETDYYINNDIVSQLKKNTKDGVSLTFELECVNRVIKILALTIKHIEENKNDLFLRNSGTASIERSREILNFMHEHYREKLTVEDISKHIGISRNECFRCFKQFMGKNPIEYLNNYRLLKSAQMLKETEKSIEEISAECGFTSASFFGKVFKEKYEKTPLQFRKQDEANTYYPESMLAAKVR